MAKTSNKQAQKPITIQTDLKFEDALRLVATTNTDKIKVKNDLKRPNNKGKATKKGK